MTPLLAVMALLVGLAPAPPAAADVSVKIGIGGGEAGIGHGRGFSKSFHRGPRVRFGPIAETPRSRALGTRLGPQRAGVRQTFEPLPRRGRDFGRRGRPLIVFDGDADLRNARREAASRARFGVTETGISRRAGGFGIGFSDPLPPRARPAPGDLPTVPVTGPVRGPAPVQTLGDPAGTHRIQPARGVRSAGLPVLGPGVVLPASVPHVTLDWRAYDLDRPPTGAIYARVAHTVLLIEADTRRVIRVVEPG